MNHYNMSREALERSEKDQPEHKENFQGGRFLATDERGSNVDKLAFGYDDEDPTFNVKHSMLNVHQSFDSIASCSSYPLR